MAKANAVVSLTKKDGVVTVHVMGFPPMTVALFNKDGKPNLDEAIITQAAMHGLGQKLVDSAALSRDTASGKSATPAEKYEAIKATYDSIMAGTWNAEREGGATSILFESLCLMLADQSPDSIRATLDGMTDAEKRALPLDPEVAPFYKRVKDARDVKRGAGVDTKAVLGRFKS